MAKTESIYKQQHRKEKNRIIRIQKHLKKHPKDVKSESRIPELQKIIVGK